MFNREQAIKAQMGSRGRGIAVLFL